MENLSSKHVLPTKLLLLVPKEEEMQTKSGLIIPGSANKVTSLGSVLIVGSAVKEVQIDSKVMFSPHAGIKVRLDDVDYTLINNTDILLFW